MGTTINGDYIGGLREKRLSAKKRLEQQLISGIKPLESARLQVGQPITEKLTEGDIKRIKKEIESLKAKL